MSFVALPVCRIYPTAQTEPEIHLIPFGYRGPVVIMYDMPNGDSIEYENGKRVLRIPVNGLLRTQFKQVTGWYEPGSIKYYYLDSTGKRTELSCVDRKNDIQDSSRIHIFNGGNGIVQSNSFERSYDYYMVGMKTDNEQVYAIQADKMIDGKVSK